MCMGHDLVSITLLKLVDWSKSAEGLVQYIFLQGIMKVFGDSSFLFW